ncbi:unnamed protein product [Litomosoides sigmodontis]|uniref:CWH43-like N-terminal domain-containing protein n=1 Tax=Litomosoides sigmodontis TaxID=42156 RepID=A0A3P6UDA8_LITSI|nr:unnamed protein product [Litomosoides sigmodontis]
MIHSTTTIPTDSGEISAREKEADKKALNKGSSVSAARHRVDVNKTDRAILLEISFQTYAAVTVGAPILALLVAFSLGFSLDYQQILNYDWTCGPVNMPSFSRIINLPKERLIWNAAVLFHLPLRFLLIFINYRICRIPSNEICNLKLHGILSQMILPSGSVEILMILLLTVIGEREEIDELRSSNFNWHVHFFVIFTISSTIYFAVVTVTYRASKHYTEHFNGNWSFNLKFYFTLIYIALVPILFTFFVMYWTFCYNFAYDFFALSEYLLILVNYGFHASTIYDCNDIYQFKMLKHRKIS